jgi:hypothetical protein
MEKWSVRNFFTEKLIFPCENWIELFIKKTGSQEKITGAPHK